MSCGKPHDVPCSEVLARVYVYLTSTAAASPCPGSCAKRCSAASAGSALKSS